MAQQIGLTRSSSAFAAINQVFQTVRNDPEAALFGFDQYGHVYIHESTHNSALPAARRLRQSREFRDRDCRDEDTPAHAR
jgi:hypothetical protein